MKLSIKRKKLQKILEKFEKAQKQHPNADVEEKIGIIRKKLTKIDDRIPKSREKKKSTNERSVSNGSVEVEATAARLDESELPGTSHVVQFGHFSELSLSEETMAGIGDMKFENMTPIQMRAIPYLLDGKDVVASAKTGSGKTLAFLIPLLELLHKLKFKLAMGTAAIIVSPTRELSMQTYGVLKDLSKYHKFRVGIVMGGADRAAEAEQLEKGVTILVAVPGRLLDHMQNTSKFVTKHLISLVIDEADRILDIGFEVEMQQILRLLPKRRQTMLFSATLNKKTKALASTAMRDNCVHVEVDSETPEHLQQGFVVCEPQRRFDLLYNFLRKNRDKKIMVFMSACLEVRYYSDLLNYIDLNVMSIHGRQKQSKRTETFFEFCRAESAILLCTDVAARGLDIPDVHWIIQYDPPDDLPQYIHRIGRTARAGNSGQALLILRPHEIGFLKEIEKSRIQTVEFDIKWSKVAVVQDQVENLVSRQYYLARMAHDGYKCFVRAYASHKLKEYFNVERLNLTLAANNFGLKVPPFVDLKAFAKIREMKRENYKRFDKKIQKSKIYRKKS